MTTYLEIQVFPMVNQPDGSATLIEFSRDEADFYDVLFTRRHEDMGEIEIIEEHENLDLMGASQIAEELQNSNPDASFEWIYE